MKKIFTLLVLMILLMPIKTKAITKEELLNYVNKQSSSDSETATLLEKYSLQFTKMINSKELKEEEINNIYDNLLKANEIIKENKVTKKEDLELLPESVKSSVKSAIYDTVLTIAEAPSNSEHSSIITINDDNTIDFIINGSLIDKIDLSSKSFNYVGFNKSYIFIIISSFTIFIISLIIIIKKKKNRFLNDLFTSTAVFSLIIGLLFCLFSSQINKTVSLTNLFRKNDKDLILTKALVNKNHEVINYPSYYSKYANLIIPRLNIEKEVAYGDDSIVLNGYVGQDTTSYLPGEGKTIIYSVHNYKVMNLEKIKNGDEIIIDTDYGTFTYKVDKIKVMNTNEYNSISLKDKNERLVLYTCYPFNLNLYGNKRFVIFATLTKEKWVES